MLISVEAKVGQEGLDPYTVAEIWLPPQAGTAVCGKDIALLLLSGSGVPSSLVTPIEPRLNSEIGANDEFVAIGYGLQDPDDENGSTAGHRMSVTGASVFCTGMTCGTDIVAQGEWIADSPVCSGDSGGPALDENGHVAGVTSRGDADCTLGIYTSVYAWSDFIKDGAFDAAARGGYAPPAWAGEPPPGNGGATASGGGGNGSGGASNQPTAGAATLAGTGNVIGGGSGTGSPTIDPLGLSCTNRCPGNYACWAESDEPPGICVPRCGAALPECPEGYSCNMAIEACVRTEALAGSPKKESSGCSVGAASTPSSGALGLLGLGVSALLLSRRRRRGTQPRRAR
jgi:MYXO-CTERM domain-containing protein